MNIDLEISLLVPAFTSFGDIPRSGNAGSYGSSTFNFLKNCHTLQWLHHFTPAMHKGSNFSTFSPNTCHFLLFLITAIQMDVKWYLTVVLICISLMVSDDEHLFMYRLAICISSLENFYSDPLPIF